jgi:hypothetical protein
VHTVELLPDAELADDVRRLWSLLRDAGLKSLADHPHPTNRPHLTVITAESLAGLPPLGLPIAVELGEVVLLGRALVREVRSTARLSALHAEVRSALRHANPWPPVAQWRPHVSLALNVPAAQHARARDLLADLPPAHGQFVAARSYDTQTRTVTDL